MLLYEQIPTGTGDGQWHYLGNGPYPMGPSTHLAMLAVPQGATA